MSTKRARYRARLRDLDRDRWERYLRDESGLPGPRGNLELAAAAADEGDRAQFEAWAALPAEEAPTGDPGEFVAFCGVLGLGECIAAGDETLLPRLREHASDPRWRVREAVAMALQRIGDRDTARLRAELPAWLEGSWLERRAAAAGLCEPRLLADASHAAWVLDRLDRLTADLPAGRGDPEQRVLRKGLGYCWSVAITAAPEAGFGLLEKWAGSGDPDIRWVVRENLKKNRLWRLAPDRVEVLAGRVAAS